MLDGTIEVDYEQNWLKEALSYWYQAGERAYEVLIEQGLYENFLAHLQKQSFMIEGNSYRGTRRHFQLEIYFFQKYYKTFGIPFFKR